MTIKETGGDKKRRGGKKRRRKLHEREYNNKFRE